jgi:hypothetical protein
MLEACVSQQEQQFLITNNKQIHNILKCSVTSIWPTSDIIKLKRAVVVQYVAYKFTLIVLLSP